MPPAPTPPVPTPTTYLSERGYGFVKSECPELVEQLRARLTVKPYVSPNSPNYGNVTQFPVYCESGKKLYIPKAYGLEHFGIPTHDNLPDGTHAPGLVFQGTVRPEQVDPIQAFLDAARDPLRRGGIISVPCGFGKSPMSLYIACQLKKKTIVVCHKGFLLNQWRERIEQFVPNARVGLIKQDRVITEGCDIVLASLQSLAMRDYPPSVFQGFHLTVIDEVHHTSAEVFSRALPKITAPVMLGLSATLKRADGLSKVFEWYIGKPVFVSKRRDATTDILLLPYTNDNPAFSEEIRIWNGKLNVAQMITRVCSFNPRNEKILDTLQTILEKEPNRKTLILSDRREHLATLEKMITRRNMGTVGYYVGGMKDTALKESESRDIILGTFTMACVADDTIIVDPITGKEHALHEFEKYCGEGMNAHEHDGAIPTVVAMYYSTGSFHLSNPTRFGYSPQKPCLRIVHELGDITVSTDHKVCTTQGWKFAGELTLADYLVAPNRLDVKSREIDHLYNCDLWVAGCFLGKATTGTVPDKDVHEHVTDIMKKSQGANHLCMIIEAQRTHDTYYSMCRDMMYLPEEKICSIIGGIFDIAGSVHGHELVFTLRSLHLIHQLRTLLLRLRIRTTTKEFVKPGNPYELTVFPEDTPLFVSIMDVRGARIQQRMRAARDIIQEFPEVLEKRPMPPMLSSLMYPVRILSIHPVDPSTVRLCDIEVPRHHSFLASGIIVHNSEGMDIPALNTLVLASPVSSVEQSVGRVQRQKEHEREYTPLVIDVWDQFSLFKAQGFKRQQFYKKNKYNITALPS